MNETVKRESIDFTVGQVVGRIQCMALVYFSGPLGKYFKIVAVLKKLITSMYRLLFVFVIIIC